MKKSLQNGLGRFGGSSDMFGVLKIVSSYRRNAAKAGSITF